MSMKRANGDGSVYRIGGKRRKPWGARITCGWQIDANTGKVKQVYQQIGTFATRPEAEKALNSFLENPYDIDAHKITFSEAYDRWSSEYYETLKNPSSARSYKAAYAYCQPLYNMRMRDIRVEHMQGVIKDAKVGDATKGRMKSLFNLLFKWCMIHEVVEKDYSALFVQKIGKRNKENRVPFSDKEILLLWEHEEAPFVDLVLVGLYTGFRPTEICLLENEKIDLEAGLMIGGIKTEAGTDRTVPIHSKIFPIVKKHWRSDRKFLFVDERQTALTYDQYRGRFKHIMQWLHMDHTPHETRHTFITNAEQNGMPRDILKLIVGHELNDITEKYYIHRSLDDLRTGIELVDYTRKK